MNYLRNEQVRKRMDNEDRKRFRAVLDSWADVDLTLVPDDLPDLFSD